MNTATQMDFKAQSATLIATCFVLNMMWWMVMVAAIGLGATHLGSCPVQPYIPIYLIVMGATSIISLTLTYTSGYSKQGVLFILSALLHVFSFCWFIAGTCWVYPIYPPNYSQGTDPYCHRTIYLFAFVVTTLVWICSGCFLIMCCCALLCTAVAGGRLVASYRPFLYGAVGDPQEAAAGDV
ncbi:transmembrane protein 272-like [Pholidichthys leucotaenia]